MRARGDAFVRFGERLARAPDLTRESARSIAAELDVPHATALEWWRHLEFHRAILTTGGETLVDRPRLLQVFTAHRLARLTPAQTRLVGVDAQALSRALTTAAVPHALGMLSAANEWAFFEPRRSIQLYAPRAMLSRLRELAPPDRHGDFRLEIFTENLANLPIVRRGGIPVTSAFQTLLDCRAHPEGGAHAAFLETQVMRWAAP